MARTKQKYVESLGEGVTHLIINGENTDHISNEKLEGHLHYLDNFVSKLRTLLNDRIHGERRW